jgi:hypothetical protein
MSPRKPPRVADWLLDRFGLTGQNPPLAGDLLEEFRNGRSAAWYWRQTLVAISIGSVRNVRLCSRSLTGTIVGWAAQAGVAFFLWRFHWLPQPPQIVRIIGDVATDIFLLWLVFSRKRTKTAASRPLPGPQGMVACAWFQFSVTLPVYCMGMLLGVPPQLTMEIQLIWLYASIRDVLVRGA